MKLGKLSKKILMTSLILSSIALVGCTTNNSTNKENNNSDNQITVQHKLGTTKLNSKPKKIAVLELSFLDSLHNLDIDPVAIADDGESNKVTDVTNGEKIDYVSVGDRKEPTEYVYDENLDVDKLNVIYKMYISISKEKESELTLKDTLGNLRFVPDYLMFQYDAKHQGILDMMEHIGGDLKDVVVFGDDTNDKVMFDPQWTSVAMGNACQELKDIATIVTDANVDDGIYNICKKMEWI